MKNKKVNEKMRNEYTLIKEEEKCSPKNEIHKR